MTVPAAWNRVPSSAFSRSTTRAASASTSPFALSTLAKPAWRAASAEPSPTVKHLEVAARAERGEGAHAVGAGEQQGLHAGKVDLGIIEMPDLQQRLDQHRDAALLKGVGQRPGIFDRAGD